MDEDVGSPMYKSKGVQIGDGFESISEYTAAFEFAEKNDYGFVEFIDVTDEPRTRNLRWRKNGGPRLGCRERNRNYMNSFSSQESRDQFRIRHMSKNNGMKHPIRNCVMQKQNRDMHVDLQRTSSRNNHFRAGAKNAYLFELAKQIDAMQKELEVAELERVNNRNKDIEAQRKEGEKSTDKLNKTGHRRKITRKSSRASQTSLSCRRKAVSSITLQNSKTTKLSKNETKHSQDLDVDKAVSSLQYSSGKDFNNGSVTSLSDRKGSICDKPAVTLIEKIKRIGLSISDDEINDEINGNEEENDDDFEEKKSETSDAANQTEPYTDDFDQNHEVSKFETYSTPRGTQQSGSIENTLIERVKYVTDMGEDDVIKSQSDFQYDDVPSDKSAVDVLPGPPIRCLRTTESTETNMNSFVSEHVSPVWVLKRPKNAKRFVSRTILAVDNMEACMRQNSDARMDRHNELNNLTPISTGLQKAQGDIIGCDQMKVGLSFSSGNGNESDSVSRSNTLQMKQTSPLLELFQDKFSILTKQKADATECGNNNNKMKFEQILFRKGQLECTRLCTTRIFLKLYKQPTSYHESSMQQYSNCFNISKNNIDIDYNSDLKPVENQRIPEVKSIVPNPEDKKEEKKEVEESMTDSVPLSGHIKFTYRIVVTTVAEVFEAKQDTFHAIMGIDQPPVTPPEPEMLSACHKPSASCYIDNRLCVLGAEEEDENNFLQRCPKKDKIDLCKNTNANSNNNNNDNGCNSCKNSLCSQDQESTQQRSDCRGVNFCESNNSLHATTSELEVIGGELESELEQMVGEERDGTVMGNISFNQLVEEDADASTSTGDRNSSKIIHNLYRTKSPPRQVTLSTSPIRHEIPLHMHSQTSSSNEFPQYCQNSQTEALNSQQHCTNAEKSYPIVNPHQKGMVFSPTTENYWRTDHSSPNNSETLGKYSQNDQQSNRDSQPSAKKTSTIDCYRLIESRITESENALSQRLHSLKTSFSCRLKSLENLVERKLDTALTTIRKLNGREHGLSDSSSSSDGQVGPSNILFSSRPNLVVSTGFHPTSGKSSVQPDTHNEMHPQEPCIDVMPNNNYLDPRNMPPFSVVDKTINRKKKTNYKTHKRQNSSNNTTKRRNNKSSAFIPRSKGKAMVKNKINKGRKPSFRGMKRRSVIPVAESKPPVTQGTYRRQDHTRRCRLRRHLRGDQSCSLCLMNSSRRLNCSRRLTSRNKKSGHSKAKSRQVKIKEISNAGRKRRNPRNTPSRKPRYNQTVIPDLTTSLPITMSLNEQHLNKSNCATKKCINCKRSRKVGQTKRVCGLRRNLKQLLDEDHRGYAVTNAGYRRLANKLLRNNADLLKQIADMKHALSYDRVDTDDLRRLLVFRFNQLLANSSDQRVNNLHRILFPAKEKIKNSKSGIIKHTANKILLTSSPSRNIQHKGIFAHHVDSLELIRHRPDRQNNNSMQNILGEPFHFLSHGDLSRTNNNMINCNARDESFSYRGSIECDKKEDTRIQKGVGFDSLHEDKTTYSNGVLTTEMRSKSTQIEADCFHSAGQREVGTSISAFCCSKQTSKSSLGCRNEPSPNDSRTSNIYTENHLFLWPNPLRVDHPTQIKQEIIYKTTNENHNCISMQTTHCHVRPYGNKTFVKFGAVNKHEKYLDEQSCKTNAETPHMHLGNDLPMLVLRDKQTIGSNDHFTKSNAPSLEFSAEAPNHEQSVHSSDHSNSTQIDIDTNHPVVLTNSNFSRCRHSLSNDSLLPIIHQPYHERQTAKMQLDMDDMHCFEKATAAEFYGRNEISACSIPIESSARNLYHHVTQKKNEDSSNGIGSMSKQTHMSDNRRSISYPFSYCVRYRCFGEESNKYVSDIPMTQFESFAETYRENVRMSFDGTASLVSQFSNVSTKSLFTQSEEDNMNIMDKEETKNPLKVTNEPTSLNNLITCHSIPKINFTKDMHSSRDVHCEHRNTDSEENEHKILLPTESSSRMKDEKKKQSAVSEWLTTIPYLTVRAPGLSTRWTISMPPFHQTQRFQTMKTHTDDPNRAPDRMCEIGSSSQTSSSAGCSSNKPHLMTYSCQQNQSKHYPQELSHAYETHPAEKTEKKYTMESYHALLPPHIANTNTHFNSTTAHHQTNPQNKTNRDIFLNTDKRLSYPLSKIDSSQHDVSIPTSISLSAAPQANNNNATVISTRLTSLPIQSARTNTHTNVNVSTPMSRHRILGKSNSMTSHTKQTASPGTERWVIEANSTGSNTNGSQQAGSQLEQPVFTRKRKRSLDDIANLAPPKKRRSVYRSCSTGTLLAKGDVSTKLRVFIHRARWQLLRSKRVKPVSLTQNSQIKSLVSIYDKRPSSPYDADGESSE